MYKYLVMQSGKPLFREVLAALFWPNDSDKYARKNLRQSLYLLRKLLGDLENPTQPFLLVTHQTVQFNPESDFTLDVNQFLAAIAARDLEIAVTLYHGDLLPGFTCESLQFEDWLRSERERLHHLALDAMAGLTARYLRNGRIVEAQALARRQLLLEPWLEVAHQQLIEALALAGNRGAALTQFVRCQEILAEELDIPPSPEIYKLIERIQNNDLRPIDPDLIAGRYSLEEEIGRGTMGIVFRGRDNQTKGMVAIKLLDVEKSANQPELVKRFLQEGEALRQLNQPNIVTMLAADERNGRYYLVMDYIPGGDLRNLLQAKGSLPIEQVLAIGLDLADALTRAHCLNILHRDLKPGNVLLDEYGTSHLTDFGLARLGQDSELTEHGAILGTLAYLSPEACMGQILDERADIWSFGVLLYEILTGQRPFKAPVHTPAAIFSHILNDPIPDIHQIRPDIPESLEDLLYRMLAKNRVERIPSVRLVGAELEAILKDTTFPSSNQALYHAAKKAREGAFATPTPEGSIQVRHNLPAQTTPFIGRTLELAELERLLVDPQRRLVTILGPGGIGKTYLALEAASRLVDNPQAQQISFPDGIFFVELAALETSDQMLTAVAATLELTIGENTSPLEQISSYLANKQLLLLLDNFEQLLASPHSSADIIAALLKAAPKLQILITSRQKLNLSSEILFVVEGLDYPDRQITIDAMSYSAVQLFVQSVQRTRFDFKLSAEFLPHIVRICRLTEGMPLGILLAASWIDILPIDEIADEIQINIDFLESDMKDLPPRQRSMRAVFDHSWGLLPKAERHVLARLSVFRRGFTRAAVQNVTGATLRQLLALVHKSLIQRDVTSGRFEIHELLRQYSAEYLTQIDDTAAIQTAHGTYFLRFVQQFETDLKGPKQEKSLKQIIKDTENILLAWNWAVYHRQVEIINETLEALFLLCFIQHMPVQVAIRLFAIAEEQIRPGTETNSDVVWARLLFRHKLMSLFIPLKLTPTE